MTVEDRLRATTEALSGVMRELRPLPPLPAERPGLLSRPRGPRRWPGWPGWLVPLTAAVAVIAVAATLVAIRDSRSGGPASPAPVVNSAATIPRYYASLYSYSSPTLAGPDVIVGDSRTGKVLTRIKAPASLSFIGVTGAADDREFVIDAITSNPTPCQECWNLVGARVWYLLRLAPGSSHPVTMTRLPITALTESDEIEGLALSPDGDKLAVLSQFAKPIVSSPAIYRRTSLGPFTLQIFSLSTGRAVRRWTAPAGKDPGAEYSPYPDNIVGLTWTADARTLAFVFPASFPEYSIYPGLSYSERTLNVTSKGANLLADSRPVLAIPGNQGCASLLLASDGQTVVCGTQIAGAGGGLITASGGCHQQEPEFDLYSTATGRRIRVLYRYQGSCTSAVAELVWAGVGGTAIGIIEALHNTVPPNGPNRLTYNFTIVQLTPGKSTPLHLSLPEADYDVGDLAF